MGKKMKRFIRRLPIALLVIMMVSMGLGGVAYAQTPELYWTDSTGTIPSLNLSGEGEHVVTLKTDIPADRTLNAFTLTVSYDPTVVGVIEAGKPAGSAFSVVANANTPGTILVSGFSTAGVNGATASLLDVTVKGLANGSTALTPDVSKFGSGSNLPIPVNENALPINVSNVTAGPHEIFWADTSSNWKFDSDTLNLENGASDTIRLMAQVPAGNNLKAYSVTVTYDANIVGATVVTPYDADSITKAHNSATPGVIAIDGYDATGITGEQMTIVLDLNIQGLNEGTSVFKIGVNGFGESKDNQFRPEPVPLTVNVGGGQPGETNTYWVDADSGLPFTGNQLELQTGAEKVIRLIAEIPEGESLRAFDFTLTYNQEGVDVIDVTQATPAMDITKAINSSTPGIIYFNGFIAEGLTGPQSVGLVDVTVVGKNSGTTSFGIAVNHFADQTGKEFKPTPVPLAITVGAVGEAKAYFIDEAGNPISTLALDLVSTKTVTLVADVPARAAGDELKAYKFTLTYGSNVQVVSFNDDVSPFGNYAQTSSEAGTLTTNGFDALSNVQGQTIKIVELTLKGVNANTTDMLSIAVNEFGNAANNFPPTGANITNLAINISGCTAQAMLSATPLTGVAPLAVTFNTAGTVGDFSINYGDGSVPGKGLTHTYVNAGTYYAVLTATDTANNCSVQSAPVTISVTAGVCDAVATFTTSVNGLTATFNTAGSAGNLFFTYGDGQSGVSATHTYAAAGTYNVTLTASTGTCSRNYTQAVTVTGVVCNAVASLKATVTGLTATFDTTGSVGTLSFNYGDGETGTAKTHEYATSGTYTVTLTATDAANNCSKTATATVKPVMNTYPITITSGANGQVMYNGAAVAGDVLVNQGSTPTFTFAPDAGYYADVVVDGNSLGALTKYIFYPVNAAHTIDVTFRSIGDVTYTVTVITGENGNVTFNGDVVDGPVEVNAGTLPVFVMNPDEGYEVEDVKVDGISVGSLQDVTFEVPVSADHTIEVTFRLVAECDAIAQLTASATSGVAPLTVEFDTTGSVGDLVIEFMDGVTAAPAAGDTLEHTFQEVGIYNVTMTATDTLNNCSKTAVVEVKVTDETVCNAVAKLSASPASGYAPLAVTFNTAGSVGELSFNYGDGQSGESSTHVYSSAGIYSVMLRAYDAENKCYSNVYETVTVLKEELCDAKALLTASPTSGDYPLTVEFNTAGSAGDLLIDFDDGGDTATPLAGDVVTHTYTSEGIYNVVLTASDDVNNCERTATSRITVTIPSIPKVKVYVTAGANGRIYPSDQPDLTVPFELTVNQGSDMAFTVLPDEGFEIDTVLVNGQPVTVDENNEFIVYNIGPDTTIHATYIKITDTFIIKASVRNNKGGIISPIGLEMDDNGNVEVEAGSKPTFIMIADEEYEIDSVIVDGVAEEKAVSVYTFDKIDRNRTIEVVFKAYEFQPPSTPYAVEPDCDSDNVPPNTALVASAFNNPVADEDLEIRHFWSEFQISKSTTMASGGDGFENFVFRKVKSTPDLESVNVADFILQEETKYFWIVRYANNRGGVSEWSEPCSFTTMGQHYIDAYGVLIPVTQKIEADDKDKYFPNVTDSISIATPDGLNAVGIMAGSNSDIVSFSSVAAGTVAAPSGIAMQQALAAFTMELEDCNNPIAEVTVYLTKSMPSNAKWYQYDRENMSMVEYVSPKGTTGYPKISADRKSVILAFRNGGRFDLDADGTNCEIIVGPSGYGIATVGIAKPFTFTGTELTATFDASNSEGQCFVWDFGDGNSDMSCETTGGPNKKPTHTYDEAGDYKVTLMVMGTNGTQATTPVTVTVPFPGGEAGGGDNCFISTTAYESAPKSGMNIALVVMLMTLAGMALSFFKKSQK